MGKTSNPRISFTISQNKRKSLDTRGVVRNPSCPCDRLRHVAERIVGVGRQRTHAIVVVRAINDGGDATQGVIELTYRECGFTRANTPNYGVLWRYPLCRTR